MKFLMTIAVALICLLLSWTDYAVAQVQIPNGSFESWFLPDQPLYWAVEYPGSISQTADSYNGWAAQGDVIEAYPGFFVPPSLRSPSSPYSPYFPVSERWGSLKGFYKLTSVEFDAISIYALMFKNGTPIADAYFADSIEQSNYTQFIAPFRYQNGMTPDSAYVQITMFPGGGAASMHSGSSFKLDRLILYQDFGGVCPIATWGDASGDGEVKSSDIIYLVNYVLKLGPEPLPCPAAGDANGDGEVKSSDIIHLVNYVLKAGPPPADICALIPGVWSCP